VVAGTFSQSLDFGMNHIPARGQTDAFVARIPR